MSEIARIEEQLRRAFEGPAWSGPSVREALDGVTATQAALRPIPGAHTIWELTLHIAVWEDVVRRRALGETFHPTDAEDFPSVEVTTASAWADALAALAAGHRALRDVVAAFDERKLDQPLTPGGASGYVQFHGAAQHDLYHAGQIVLLRKR